MESATPGTLETLLDLIGKHKISTVLIGIIVLAFIGQIGTSQSSKPVATENTQTNSQAPSLSAAQASADFSSVMSTAEKANLVSSYKFSDTERVIYVTDVWYTMNVSFKKDFLAKIAMDQEAISGKHFFEVHDDHSDEKVAEVTALTGDLKVYK